MNTLDQQIKETEARINDLRFKENRDFGLVTVCRELLEMIKELAEDRKEPSAQKKEES